jgi:Aspartyl/Asparaginyl beta-hydroxylase
LLDLRQEAAGRVAMLDIATQPILDKCQLIGGCLRLPLQVDAARFAAEVDALGAGVWGTTGGRVGVHSAAEALFLRGHAPAQGDIPIADRPVLDHLPYARAIMGMLQAPPLRCLLARLPGGGSIASHIDRAPYFSKSIRIHVPVTTHERSYMFCAGLSYRMRAGEVWALNNSTHHGVWNADPDHSRTHMICDFTLTPQLAALLQAGDRSLGVDDQALREHLAYRPT